MVLPRRHRLLGAPVAVAIVLAIAACGDNTPTPTAGQAATTQPAPQVVAKDFSLTSITVPAGAKVDFANHGPSPHTVTADDGSFNTGTVLAGKGASFSAPRKAGTYAFHCSIHPQMTGTLTVR